MPDYAVPVTRRTIKHRLDALIDWYETRRPEHREPIVVGVTRPTVMRFARPEKRGGRIFYRGHEIVPNERRWAKPTPLQENH